ncbi:hypothetical protein NBC122_01408 [Chryseobacterium salivictor]|uniref:Uncharacterized protein n=1 Tax=Chryseobacterium salivictor TaxID=2547600 RepID=A0A4V1AL20_9FLAO|nr:hypothetical protein NBC122_01408 [Chryseobacterium salivictor]
MIRPGSNELENPHAVYGTSGYLTFESAADLIA